ncbi:MAG: DNA polymerase/3'-5' exonuclease PolX [Nitrospirota bacterium]
MDNKAIAKVFDEVADILDIQGGNVFRINAYRKAALNILNSPRDLRDIVDKAPNDLPKIPGIGQGLKAMIVELVQTGHSKDHEKLKKSIPAGLLEMLHIRSLGPKKVKMLYGKLGVKSIKELKKSAKDGRIRDLEGMGARSETVILKAIEEYSKFSTERTLISEAKMEALRIIEYMKGCKEVAKIEYAGSLRRGKETIGDIDILITVKDSEKSHGVVMDHFAAYDDVLNVIASGDTKSTIMLISGMHVDLRVINDDSFGAAMHYFTGNKQHNIKIRDIAKKKGLKVSEYGVFKGKKLVACKSEEDVFKAVGFPYIIPEIRRNEGEIEYALKNKKMPEFVELSDIRGDLHCHSTYSDGKYSVEEMTLAMIAKGYEYFAMTDHSSLVGVTGGMGKKDIMKQWKEIDKLNKKYDKKIKIFKGCEVDILKDGGLDFDDEVLKGLDVVIIAAHLYQRLGEKEQTKRLIEAIENPYSTMMAHPSGRLINKRPMMEYDVEKVIDACASNGVVMEINANPLRLDLIDKYVRIAKDKGVKIAINTDAHSPSQLDYMEFGVGIARRGWLQKNDILNTQPLSKLKF